MGNEFPDLDLIGNNEVDGQAILPGTGPIGAHDEKLPVMDQVAVKPDN